MIEVKSVSKSFGSNQVLRDISFDVKEGEVVVLVGPSGSGKSTLLRCINFLEEFQSGQILVDGDAVGYEDARAGAARRRQPESAIASLRTKAGMVFQNYNLFPHKTAIQNVMMGPVQVNKEDKTAAHAHALALLGKVGLAEKYNRIAGKAVSSGLVKKEDATIEQYVTRKSLDGLYTIIGDEEKKIRQDPVGTGSAILKKVFGSLK